MGAKYYTMTEEDICIGLEFEVPVYNKGKEPEEYGKTIFDFNTIECGFSKDSETGYSLPENWRIKFLDHQDIEELGWKYSSMAQKFGIVTEEDEKTGSLGIWLSKEGYRYRITDCRAYLHISVFYGYIKNKSELKKLMKMLNISVEKQ